MKYAHILSTHVPMYCDTELHSPSLSSFYAKSYSVSGLSPASLVSRMLVIRRYSHSHLTIGFLMLVNSYCTEVYLPIYFDIVLHSRLTSSPL